MGEEQQLPFAHTPQEIARTLIDEYPAFFVHTSPEETAHYLQIYTVEGKVPVSGFYLILLIEAKSNSPYTLDIIIPMIANGHFPISETEEAQVRGALFDKAELYIANYKKQQARRELELPTRHGWLDMVGEPNLAPQKIAALEKFQKSLLKRATPTPKEMRK
ncbi:MAG: hypothetical protein HYT83_02365 [Candidatus Levybacteria bacterium]|nr:hypothetical protein [Candidatus Levybacteria bacterium]